MKRSRVSRPMLIFALFSLFLTACGGSTTSTSSGKAIRPTVSNAPRTLQVFAAASLTESFKEIGSKYQTAHPGVTLKYNFAGSQALEQQLSQGAPADIFASADTTNMDKATKANLVQTPQIFAKNKLTVIIPVNNPGKINTLKDLANKGVKIDFAAATVPAGKYGSQVLDKMAASSQYGPAYKQAVLNNIVSQEDNVKAVVQKVQLGEADAGFVYQSDVTMAVSSKVKPLEIPNDLNVTASYPIAVTKSSKQVADDKTFIQYVLSADGQAVLDKYHFIKIGG